MSRREQATRFQRALFALCLMFHRGSSRVCVCVSVNESDPKGETRRRAGCLLTVSIDYDNR